MSNWILLKESCLTIREVKTKSGDIGKRVDKELADVADPIQRIINKCIPDIGSGAFRGYKDEQESLISWSLLGRHAYY